MSSALTSVHKLYIGVHRSLFLGAGHVIPIREYTVAADQLLVCLSGEIVWNRSDGKREAFRTALLRAGTTVKTAEVDSSNAVVASCFLNPIGPDYAVLSRGMRDGYEGVLLHHRDEAELIDALLQIRDQGLSPDEAFHRLDQIILPDDLDLQSLPSCDPRIVKVIWRIKETVRDNLPIGILAEEVHLSESRLVKLFKSEIGIPITRYRLRYRIMVGAVYLSLGYSVTEAALAAGFASTAHFSKCFVAIIGILPSAAHLNSPRLDVALSETVLQAVAARTATLASSAASHGEAAKATSP